MANKKEEVNVDELRAKLEAEIRAEIEKEASEKIEKEKKKREEVEEKLAATEAEMEAQIREEEKSVKQQLAEMKKVTIEIPEDPNNPDSLAIIGWGGVIYSIPRGEQHEVPEIIYQIWKDSHQKNKEINKKISAQQEMKVL